MYQISSALKNAIQAGKPQRVLLEFADGTFSNEGVSVSSGISLHEFFCQDTDLSIGKCMSAELSFVLLNDQYQLEDFGFGTFAAWLGAGVSSPTPGAKTQTFLENGKNVTYEFSPLGTFIAEKPAVLSQRTISVTANDQMILFDKEMPSAETLNLNYETAAQSGTPVTVGVLFSALCEYVGVSAATDTFLNSDIPIYKEPEAFEGATMREVLGWIAEAACANLRFSRDGLLEFLWFNSTDKTFTPHFVNDFVPSWYTTSAIDGLHIRNQNSTTEIVLGQNNNNYMIQDNPFLRQPDDAVSITTDPSSVRATVGVHVSFLTQAKGEGLAYQWQEKRGNNDFANSERAGADKNILEFTVSNADVGQGASSPVAIQFRCVVRDQYDNSVTSEAATLTIDVFEEKTQEQAEQDAEAKWPDLYDDTGEVTP